MRNHWEGYYTAAMIDALPALGVNAVRIPVGYWIMDAPVNGTSPLEYGAPEGRTFVLSKNLEQTQKSEK